MLTGTGRHMTRRGHSVRTGERQGRTSAQGRADGRVRCGANRTPLRFVAVWCLGHDASPSRSVTKRLPRPNLVHRSRALQASWQPSPLPISRPSSPSSSHSSPSLPLLPAAASKPCDQCRSCGLLQRAVRSCRQMLRSPGAQFVCDSVVSTVPHWCGCGHTGKCVVLVFFSTFAHVPQALHVRSHLLSAAYSVRPLFPIWFFLYS
jgi:hypothetical protein